MRLKIASTLLAVAGMLALGAMAASASSASPVSSAGQFCNFESNGTTIFGCAENEGDFLSPIITTGSVFDSDFSYTSSNWQIDNYGDCLQAVSYGEVIFAPCASSSASAYASQVWAFYSGTSKSGRTEYENEWATNKAGKDECLEGDETYGAI
jgi:hypothetical protein